MQKIEKSCLFFHFGKLKKRKALFDAKFDADSEYVILFFYKIEK